MRTMTHIVLLLALALLTGCAAKTTAGGDPTDVASGAEAAGRQQNAPSDASITAAIKAAYQQDELLNSVNIDVSTEQGVVMLSGRLPGGRAANRALSLARDTEGVRRVVWSNLELAP